MRLFAESLDELIADVACYIDLVCAELPADMPVHVMGHRCVASSRPLFNCSID